MGSLCRELIVVAEVCRQVLPLLLRQGCIPFGVCSPVGSLFLMCWARLGDCLKARSGERRRMGSRGRGKKKGSSGAEENLRMCP